MGLPPTLPSTGHLHHKQGTCLDPGPENPTCCLLGGITDISSQAVPPWPPSTDGPHKASIIVNRLSQILCASHGPACPACAGCCHR